MILVIAFSMICGSTQFGQDGDEYGGRTPVLLYGRPVRPGDVLIAHRYLPLGLKVRVTNIRTGISAIAIVADRGPYGLVGRKWYSARKHGHWTRRAKIMAKDAGCKDIVHCDKIFKGCGDLSPDLISKIKHNQREHVRIETFWGWLLRILKVNK